MAVADDVILADGVVIQHSALVNLYGCSIGEGTRIGLQRVRHVGRHPAATFFASAITSS